MKEFLEEHIIELNEVYIKYRDNTLEKLSWNKKMNFS